MRYLYLKRFLYVNLNFSIYVSELSLSIMGFCDYEKFLEIIYDNKGSCYIGVLFNRFI